MKRIQSIINILSALRFFMRSSVCLLIVFSVSLPVWSETNNYSYDPNGNITAIDKNGELKGYNYDALDRLVDELLGITPAFEYLYDPNGNRTSIEFNNNGVLVPFSYLLNSNRLDTVNGSGYTYDAAGNMLSDPEGRTFVYNDANRLWKVSLNGILVATYTYNAQGQRTRKATPTETLLYHYDLQGNLITETDSVGTPIKEYIWQNGQPVAMISHNLGSETITYLHTDHLNTPRKATNSSGVIVWDWQSDGFGAAPPNEDADGDTLATTVNLRFPGQYYDQESGLYYNWKRYYDPSTGRYITSDPIGLKGGNNTYGYVLANPLVGVDPVGLLPDCFKGYVTVTLSDEITEYVRELRKFKLIHPENWRPTVGGSAPPPISTFPIGIDLTADYYWWRHTLNELEEFLETTELKEWTEYCKECRNGELLKWQKDHEKEKVISKIKLRKYEQWYHEKLDKIATSGVSMP